MAVIKQKTRKKLSKTLGRLVKKYGPEMTLALVTGIISALVAENSNKASKKAGRADGKGKKEKSKTAGMDSKAPARKAASRQRASA